MKWEYLVDAITFGVIEEAQHELSRMGRDGWELVAIVPNATGKDLTWPVAIYKRPKPAKPDPN